MEKNYKMKRMMVDKKNKNRINEYKKEKEK